MNLAHTLDVVCGNCLLREYAIIQKATDDDPTSRSDSLIDRSPSQLREQLRQPLAVRPSLASDEGRK